MRIEAGGILQCDPPAEKTVSLRMGSPGQNGQDCFFRFNGTSGNLAVLRKKAGAAGLFHVGTQPGVTANLTLIGDYGHFIGIDEYTNNFAGPTGVFVLRHSVIEDGGDWLLNAGVNGIFLCEDNRVVFANRDIGRTFRCYFGANKTPGTSTLKRNRFNTFACQFLDGSAFEAEGNLNGLEADLNVFEGTLQVAGCVSFKRSFFFTRPAQEQPGSFWVGGGIDDIWNIDDAYLVMDYTSGDPGGNPHYFTATKAYTGIRKAVFDYVGPAGTDTGDALDASGPSVRCRVHDSIVLPSVPTDANPPIAAGAIWGLGPSIPRMELEHNTLFRAGIGVSHATYTGSPGRFLLRNNLSWSHAGQPGSLCFTDSTVTEDTVDPSEVLGNAISNAATHNNTVGGVTTPLKGFDALPFSVAPGVIDLDDSGGPQFVDATRNFLSWCREVRGHDSGDVSADMEAGLADINADPELAFDSLKPWVEAGFAPRNAALIGTATDGTTIGAVEGEATDLTAAEVGIASTLAIGAPVAASSLAASAGIASGLTVSTPAATATVTLTAGVASALTVGGPVAAMALSATVGIASTLAVGIPVASLDGDLSVSVGIASTLVVGSPTASIEGDPGHDSYADLLDAICAVVGTDAALITAFGREGWLWLDLAPPDQPLPVAVLKAEDDAAIGESGLDTSYLDDATFSLTVYSGGRLQSRRLVRQAVDAIEAAAASGDLESDAGQVAGLWRTMVSLGALDPDPGPSGEDVWSCRIEFRAFVDEDTL